MTKITNTHVLDKVKLSVLLLIIMFTNSLAFAQSELKTAKPLTDMEVVRKVAFLDIEGKYYEDVTMSFIILLEWLWSAFRKFVNS